MQLRRQIPSCLRDVDVLSLEIRSLLGAKGLRRLAFAVELVARECLNNAVLHGNAQCASRMVTFELRRGRRWLQLRVADEGSGFPTRHRHRAVLHDDRALHGRGLGMIRSYCERVRFNRRGNAITIWFRIHAQEKQ